MRIMSEGPLPLRILVVEDESANLDLVRASLDALGDPFLRSSVIDGASSLGEARAALAEKVFDIVLLDLWLPDGDGLSLAREVRATGREKPLIVVVSGSAQAAEQAAALKTADEFLLKPFEPASLVPTIDRLVGRR
jgi:two-component system KDP operon response regulator KdpE